MNPTTKEIVDLPKLAIDFVQAVKFSQSDDLEVEYFQNLLNLTRDDERFHNLMPWIKRRSETVAQQIAKKLEELPIMEDPIYDPVPKNEVGGFVLNVVERKWEPISVYRMKVNENNGWLMYTRYLKDGSSETSPAMPGRWCHADAEGNPSMPWAWGDDRPENWK